MGRIWAVARLTISEGLRMKIALVFIVVIMLILTALPFSVSGDGITLKSRVQSFLAYSLTGVGTLLSLLTVFLACAAITNEIRLKQIFMIVTKPIPRWQLYVGKWAGIMFLNAMLLLLTWGSVWAATMILSRQETNERDRIALNEQVLTVRHAIRPTPPDFEAMADARIRKLQEEGRLDDVTPGLLAENRENELRMIKGQWKRLEPQAGQWFRFENVRLDSAREDDAIQLRFKPGSPSGAEDTEFKAFIFAENPSDPSLWYESQQQSYVVERFHEIRIPTYCVSEDHRLHIAFTNLSGDEAIQFEEDNAIELMYGFGTFHWNLFRALLLIWCRLAFLALVGLMVSSFLSFPVACMACLLVWVAATGAGFLTEGLDSATPTGTQEDPMGFIGPLLRPLAKGFLWLVPTFSQHNGVPNIVGGRIVPLMWVLKTVIVLILTKGVIVGAMGMLILTKREVAQPTA